MPQWITIFHLFFSDALMQHGEKMSLSVFLLILGGGTAFCLLIGAMIAFEENRGTHGDAERCRNTTTALKLLGGMVFLLIAGNYGGALLLLLAGCTLAWVLFRVLQGIQISIGSCRNKDS